jgi:hypothetical protein
MCGQLRSLACSVGWSYNLAYSVGWIYSKKNEEVESSNLLQHTNRGSDVSSKKNIFFIVNFRITNILVHEKSTSLTDSLEDVVVLSP